MTALRRTAPATLATALVGTAGTHPRSDWYLGLRKPGWQPPASAFGPVWTTLYALIATASARTLDRLQDKRGRRAYAAALAVNLGLNTGFSWVYFTGRNQRAGLVTQLALDLSTVDLIRRTAQVDRTAAAMLAPYLAWGLFATVLNAEVIRLNPDRR